MSHVGSLNCSKEEGLLKLNLASKTLKFSGTNLLPPAVESSVHPYSSGLFFSAAFWLKQVVAPCMQE